MNKGSLGALLPTDHTEHDGGCTVYRRLLIIRQIEMEEGKRKLTSNLDVLRGLAPTVAYRGVTRIERRTRDEINTMQQREQQRREVRRN